MLEACVFDNQIRIQYNTPKYGSPQIAGSKAPSVIQQRRVGWDISTCDILD